MQVHFHANQSHFHKNCFPLRLALKQSELGNGLIALILFVITETEIKPKQIVIRKHTFSGVQHRLHLGLTYDTHI